MQRPVYPLRHLCILAALVLAPGGCAREYLGYQTLNSQAQHIEKENAIEDDRIEDKDPQYVEGLEVDERFAECVVRMNKSGSVVQLSLPEMEEDAELAAGLFPGRAEAIEAAESAAMAELIPSLEAVYGTTKPFNDGLYAGIEWNMQYGIDGVWSGKQDFLGRLYERLTALRGQCDGAACGALDSARVHLLAGLDLGGADVTIPGELAEAVTQAQQLFLDQPLFARPIGFYTWSDGLGGIFSQDRFFQNYVSDLDPFAEGQMDRYAAIAVALESDEALLADYLYVMGLYEVLTNPYAHYSPRELLPYVDGLDSLGDVEGVTAAFMTDHADAGTPCGPRMALFPSSRSKEATLYEELYCSASPPADITFIDLFIDRIRSGEIDLTPAPDSGWYDYQTWALETLLVPEEGPESDHLMLTAAYKKKLIDTFKSILTQNRETHIKQTDIAIGMGSAAPVVVVEVDVYPKFASEPFPTFYLRTARAYRFLLDALVATVGDGFLAATGRYRDTGDQDELPLPDAIRAEARLLYGLYLLACDSLGMERELLEEELAEFPEADCVAAAQSWLEGWKADEDVLTDPRVIVPVSMDVASGQAIYWAIIGVRVIRANAFFYEGHGPDIISVTAAPGEEVTCEFRELVPHDYYLLVEKQVEVRIPAAANPPTRDELRALCDEKQTEEAIVEALTQWK